MITNYLHQALLLVVVVPLMTVAAAAQIGISPPFVEFGDVGCDTLSWASAPYRRAFTITNTSPDAPLTIEAITARTYNGRNSMSLPQATALRRLQPGQDSRFCLEYRSYEPGGMDCPVTISYSYPGFAGPRDTVIMAHARSVRLNEPFITHMDFPDMRICDCPLNQNPDIWFAYIKILNPRPDTLTLDSFFVVTETPGIRIDTNVHAFDEIPTNYNDGTGFHPPIRAAPAPRLLLPRLPLLIQFTIYHYPLGEQRAIVRGYVSGRNGEQFVLQDTVRVRVQQENLVASVVASPSGLNSVRFNDSIQLGITLGTCSVPGNVPVTIEQVAFKGPRAALLRLVDSGEYGAMEQRPFVLPPCDDGLQLGGGLVWFHGALPAGITSDTVVVTFSYTDSLGAIIRDSVSHTYLLEVTAPLSAPFRPSRSSGTLRAAPNPTNSSLTLHWNSDELDRPASVRLYDRLGRDLGLSIPMNESGTAFVDCSSLPAGTYTAVARASNGIQATTSIVIVR